MLELRSFDAVFMVREMLSLVVSRMLVLKKSKNEMLNIYDTRSLRSNGFFYAIFASLDKSVRLEFCSLLCALEYCSDTMFLSKKATEVRK